MSRADAFEAFYRESRARLLHQVYAYAGTLEAAEQALSDAYVSAAQHWGTLADEADKDAWMRARAFNAATRSHRRGRRPWYVTARATADEHRRLLAAIGSMPPTDRHVFIASRLAGLDLAAAAREVGVTESTAQISLDRSTRTLESAGIDASAARLTPALDGLRRDLDHHPVDGATSLRRDGIRRRRSHVLLVGICASALAIGAWAIAVPRTADAPTTIVEGPSASPPHSPDPPAGPRVSTADLSTQTTVTSLDRTGRWAVDSTSADFGDTTPPDPCLTDTPGEQTAAHYWVRTFSTGHAARTGGTASSGHAAPNGHTAPGGDNRATATTATQTLEVADTTQDARTAYAAQLAAFGGCKAGAHRVVDVKTLRGIGEQASVVALQYADPQGIHEEHVALAHTGSVVTTWILHESDRRPVQPRFVVRLLANAVDTVCHDADGSCATRPYRASHVVPPPDEAASGFLSTVDLPLFEGLTDAWVATPPARTRTNPAATVCDQADFVSAGATALRSRSYVIPGARQLSDVFGMSETVGTFASRQDAKAFVDKVTSAVAGCASGDLSLTVPQTSELTIDRGTGVAWRIDLRTSKSTTVVFRVALVRLGSTVAQVTFTPSGSHDVDQPRYLALATRAAERLRQL